MSAPVYLRGDLVEYLSGLAFNETQFRFECDERLNDRQFLELYWFMTTASEDEIYAALQLQNSDEVAGIAAAVDAVRREAKRRGLKVPPRRVYKSIRTHDSAVRPA